MQFITKLFKSLHMCKQTNYNFFPEKSTGYKCFNILKAQPRQVCLEQADAAHHSWSHSIGKLPGKYSFTSSGPPATAPDCLLQLRTLPLSCNSALEWICLSTVSWCSKRQVSPPLQSWSWWSSGLQCVNCLAPYSTTCIPAMPCRSSKIRSRKT